MKLVVLAFMLAGSSPPAVDCNALARELLWNLQRSLGAKEPEDVISSVHARAAEARRECAQSEEVRYAELRSAELEINRSEDRALRDRWRSDVAAAAAEFPRSGKILTVAARATGTVADARRAVAADPRYAPAGVALARAVLAEGRPSEAAAILQNTADLARVVDGLPALAGAQLAAGDVDRAIATSKRALREFALEPIEPDPHADFGSTEAREVLGAAYLQRGKVHAAVAELCKIAGWSAQARRLLDVTDPRIHREVRKVRRCLPAQ